MALYIFVFIFVLIPTFHCKSIERNKSSSTCSEEALVACAYPVSVQSITFASTKHDLDSLCPHLHSGLRCIDNFTRVCLEPHQRSHFNRLYSGTSMVIQEICQPGHYQDEFLRHATCMKKLAGDYETCLERYDKQIHNLPQDTEDGLQSVCGYLDEYLQCSKDVVRKTCGDETARFAAGFLDRMSSSLLSKHCHQQQLSLNNESPNNGRPGTLSALLIVASMPVSLHFAFRFS